MDSPNGVSPPTKVSIWIQVEETSNNQHNQTFSITATQIDTILLNSPFSITINHKSTIQPTSTGTIAANNNLITHSSSLAKTSNNITIQPFPSTTITTSVGSLSPPTTINNSFLQPLFTPQDKIRILMFTLQKGSEMSYKNQDIIMSDKFLLFDFHALLEQLEESMKKCYQILENINTTTISIYSELISCTQTGKNIEKDISKYVTQCCGSNGDDSSKDILKDNHTESGKTIMDYEFFRNFLQNSQTKQLMQRIDYFNLQRDILFKSLKHISPCN